MELWTPCRPQICTRCTDAWPHTQPRRFASTFTSTSIAPRSTSTCECDPRRPNLSNFSSQPPSPPSCPPPCLKSPSLPHPPLSSAAAVDNGPAVWVPTRPAVDSPNWSSSAGFRRTNPLVEDAHESDEKEAEDRWHASGGGAEYRALAPSDAQPP